MKIEEYLAESREEILQKIGELVAIPSTEDRPEAVAEALEWCLEECRKAGMRTGKAKNGDSGWAEIGDGEETVGVLSHVDVVKIGDRSKWRQDPFTMVEENGTIIGRGVIDDKGPVVLSIYAVKALQEAKIPLGKKIRLIFGTSEETDWTDMANYREEFGAPDCGFSPDGHFPIFNVERGYMDVTLRFRDGKLRKVASLCAGDSPNTVPSFAEYREMGNTARKWQGVSVHSSMPENGQNAILSMCRALEGYGWKFAKFVTAYLDGEADGDWTGKKLGLPYEDTWEGVYVGKTSMCPTVLRLEGKELVLNVNVRVRCGIDPEDVVKAFAAKGEEYGFTVSGKAENMPVMVPQELPFLQVMHKVYTDTGREGGFKVATGASYAQCMPHCVAWGPAFPDEIMTAHKENESADVENLMTAAGLYAKFLSVYCAAPKPKRKRAKPIDEPLL